MADADKCFVVMPFGVKPRNDGTDRTYNFDKVYRVIIQRAINNVKMQPLRADETEGSRVIHADMFKDLRWFQVFILADMGKYDDAQKRAQAAITMDIRFSSKEEETEVGRRQYSELRRLLENFSRYWRDPKSIARVSQIINSAHIN